MMENFSNLVKEMDIKPQEAQRIPKIRNLKRLTPRHIIVKMPKVKYKEKNLKAAREKQIITYKGTPIRLATDFSKTNKQTNNNNKKNYAGQKGLAKNIQKNEDPGYTTKNNLSSKAIT